MRAVVAAVLAAAMASPALAENDGGFFPAPFAIAGLAAGGLLGAADLVMLGTSIASGTSAHTFWEVVGFVVGTPLLGYGMITVLGTDPDARPLAAVALGTGTLMIAGAFWSTSLPARASGIAFAPMIGEGTGIVLGGTF